MVNDTLLERYLQAVGKFLPEASRADVLAELRANLLEQMDGREEMLGRSLNDGDVASILLEHGKPAAVALRYLPQQSLIGPTVYPFYEYTLYKTLPLVVFAYTLAKAVEFATEHHGSFSHLLTQYAFGLVPVLLTFWGVMTLVFAVIDRSREQPDVRARLTQWDPMKLPKVEKLDPEQMGALKSLPKRVADLVFHCLWFAYVLWVPWHPFWMFGPGVFVFGGMGLALAPVWHTFYALLIVQLSVQLVVKLLALSPSMARVVKPAELITHVLGLVAIGTLARASVLFVAANASANVHNLADVNEGMILAFRVALVVVFAGVLKQVWRYAKGWQGARQFAF